MQWDCLQWGQSSVAEEHGKELYSYPSYLKPGLALFMLWDCPRHNEALLSVKNLSRARVFEWYTSQSWEHLASSNLTHLEVWTFSLPGLNCTLTCSFPIHFLSHCDESFILLQWFFCGDPFLKSVILKEWDRRICFVCWGSCSNGCFLCRVFFIWLTNFIFYMGFFSPSSCILGHWFSNFSTLKNPREHLIRQWCIFWLVSWRFWLSRFGMGPKGYFSWSLKWCWCWCCWPANHRLNNTV